jgi:DNA topoisomerase I
VLHDSSYNDDSVRVTASDPVRYHHNNLNSKPLIDRQKTIALVEKGRRAKWWRRKGSPSRGFSYEDSDGKRITSEETLERIKALVIPPAWRFVRISPAPTSKIQAVGVDTIGRVQYLYNPKFAESQQRKKFAKIERFGEYLPGLRQITSEHVSLDGFPRDKVLAIMIRLINSLYIRMGAEQSVRRYKTYGITTLKNRHLEIRRNGELIFQFVGKSGVKQRKVLVDEELAALMNELKQLGDNRKLFHYIDDDGKPRAVRPSDINQYIKSITAPEFSAKDFRTWGATLLAAVQLAENGIAESEAETKKSIVRAVRFVAEQLGNTPTVCRSSYIHPLVIKAYTSGVTIEHFQPRDKRRARRIESGVEPEEESLLKLFNEWRNGSGH